MTLHCFTDFVKKKKKTEFQHENFHVKLSQSYTDIILF